MLIARRLLQSQSPVGSLPNRNLKVNSIYRKLYTSSLRSMMSHMLQQELSATIDCTVMAFPHSALLLSASYQVGNITGLYSQGRLTDEVR